MDGVVTDDNDVFLFGAQRVYRQACGRWLIDLPASLTAGSPPSRLLLAVAPPD